MWTALVPSWARPRRDLTPGTSAADGGYVTAVSEPIPGPEFETPTEEMADASGVTPRLARHRITLSDGHEVGISVSVRGVPLVVVHGFTAEGLLYAQTLSRLVSMGFKVIAVDTAGSY